MTRWHNTAASKREGRRPAPNCGYILSLISAFGGRTPRFAGSSALDEDIAEVCPLPTQPGYQDSINAGTTIPSPPAFSLSLNLFEIRATGAKTVKSFLEIYWINMAGPWKSRDPSKKL